MADRGLYTSQVGPIPGHVPRDSSSMTRVVPQMSPSSGQQGQGGRVSPGPMNQSPQSSSLSNNMIMQSSQIPRTVLNSQNNNNNFVNRQDSASGSGSDEAKKPVVKIQSSMQNRNLNQNIDNNDGTNSNAKSGPGARRRMKKLEANQYVYDTSKDKEIVRAMKLGDSWEKALLGPDGNDQLSCFKIETIAALKVQSRWRAHTACKTISAKERDHLPFSQYYSDEMIELRMKIHTTFEDSSSSRAAHYLSITILAVIVLSILSLIMETIPEIMPPVDKMGNSVSYDKSRFVVHKSTWTQIDVICTVVFTVEFVLRLWCSNAPQGKSVSSFMKTPMNVCDLLAISPLYIEIIFAGGGAGFLRVLRAIRLVRLFRIFKLGRYSTALKLMFSAIVNSIEILFVLLFILMLGVILFSSVMFYVEMLSCPKNIDQWGYQEWQQYVNDCESSTGGVHKTQDYLCCDEFGHSLDFPNILQALYWNMITITTVGYGDLTPRTPQGKIVASLALLAGVLLIALPVAVVGSKFQETYDAMETDKNIEGIRNSISMKLSLPVTSSHASHVKGLGGGGGGGNSGSGGMAGLNNFQGPSHHTMVYLKHHLGGKDDHHHHHGPHNHHDELSDPIHIPFTDYLDSMQKIETEDTEFFMKVKKLQRLIDQSIAAHDMMHRLEGSEKVRQYQLHLALQKFLMKFTSQDALP